MRTYRVFYWVADDHHETEFQSNYRAGSRANKQDAMQAIRKRAGRSIAQRAEIAYIELIRSN